MTNKAWALDRSDAWKRCIFSCEIPFVGAISIIKQSILRCSDDDSDYLKIEKAICNERNDLIVTSNDRS
jgi:hypothetical protein